MSDTDKITAEIKTKVKDPKRVEAGKKLAALSKAAREKKKAMTETPPPSNWNYSVIGVAGVVIAMASLLIAYKSYNKKKEVQRKPEPEPEEKTVQQPVPSSNLESL